MQAYLFKSIYIGFWVLSGLTQAHAEMERLSGKPLKLLDAVQITIENSPDILQQRLAFDMAKASEQMTSSMFDVNTKASLMSGQNRTYLPGGMPEMHTFDLMLSGGASKMFRSGLITDFSAEIYRSDTTDASPEILTTNSAKVTFSLIVPLLKGRGMVSAAAEETAARLEREAAMADLRHALSATVLSTVQAYWDYKAAVVNLKNQQSSEQRVQGWQGSIQFSKSGGLRFSGDLAAKKRIVSEAEEQLNNTKSALAIAMGIPADQVALIGEPDLDFDSRDMSAGQVDSFQENWKQLALSNRLDLQAASLRQQGSTAKLAKARHDLSPQLNLTLSAGYMGLTEDQSGNGFFRSLNKNVPGPNASATLDFSYALDNNLARGEVALNHALNQQNLIARNELQRGIIVNIGVLAGTLKNGLNAVEKNRETADSYEQSLKALLNGDAPDIVDLLDIEEMLMTASTKEVEATRELAKRVAEVRFHTGTLIASSTDIDSPSSVQLADLTQLPQ